MCEAPASSWFPAPRCLGCGFRGPEYRSGPLPTLKPSFPDSAPSQWRLTGKGLTPLSSLSFSRSAFFPADTRRGSTSGESVLPPPGSRRQRALPEPVERFTRLVTRVRDCGPESRRGISRRSKATAPAPTSNRTTPPVCTAERFPLARIRGPAGRGEGVDR